MTKCLAIVLLLAAPLPASAQSGAFNMGGLTATLSQGGVTRSEQRRAGGYVYRRPSRAGAARIASICRNRYALTREPGDEPDFQRLARICRANGL